jgi:type I restriction enzyme, S subunit
MEVKPGYKQTEVGVIPEEWGVSAFESVARIIDPQPDHRTPPEAIGGDPYIGISDFLDDHSVNWEASRKIIPRAVDKQRLSFRIRPGDILFGKIGTIGSPRFVPITPFRYALSANVLLIQPHIPPYFMMSWLQSSTCQRAINGELHSTSQAAFGINKMRRVKIPLPPEREQRAIAAALSDVDALLGGLDRLITKKRDLKRAAMQQLLTGETRLPSFHGEWGTKQISQIAPLQRGFDLPNPKLRRGPYPVVYSNGILNHHSDWRVEGPGVVTGRSGTIGRVTFVEGNFWPHNTALWVTSFNGNNPKFIFYLYMRIGFERFATGSGVPTLNRNDVHAFEVLMPPTTEEQAAIASVLTDMDTELATLERRREKTRDLKQAMMQELLTGKTRLLPTGATHA